MPTPIFPLILNTFKFSFLLFMDKNLKNQISKKLIIKDKIGSSILLMNQLNQPVYDLNTII